MKDNVVAPNHLKTVKSLLEKCLNLLNEGRDILPYQFWRDRIEKNLEEIKDFEEDN